MFLQPKFGYYKVTPRPVDSPEMRFNLDDEVDSWVSTMVVLFQITRGIKDIMENCDKVAI